MSLRSAGRADSRGIALFAGAALALVAFAAWWITQDTDAPGRLQAAAAKEPEEEADRADLKPALSEAERDQARVASAVTAPEATARAANTPPEPGVDPPLTEGVPVVVLRGASSERVPFALVSVGEAFTYDGREGFLHREKAGIKRIQTLRRFRADEDGFLILPMPGVLATAYAEDGDDWGWLTYRAPENEDPQELRIYPDADVVVRVVDPQTREPVEGVDVELLWDLGQGDINRLDGETTGADGLAVFPHLRQHTEGYWAHTERILVALAGVLPDTAVVEVDPSDVPELVELEVEPFSAVDVKVVDREGRTVTEPVRVTLEGPGHEDGDSRKQAFLITETGSVSFEQVRPGTALRVHAQSYIGASTKTQELVAPANAGVRIPVTAILRDPPPAIVGRLVLEDGSPVADRSVYAMVGTVGEMRRYSARAETDAEGHFRLRPTRRALGGAQIEVAFDLRDEEPPLSARIEVAGPLNADALVGDVRLGAASIVASGWVREEGGAPIRGARVTVSSVNELTNGRRSLRSFGQVRTEADGSFTAYGYATSEMVSLHARHDEHGNAERQTFPAGTRDIHLTLPAGGRITGNVLLDEEWFCDFTLVSARPANAEEWQHEAWLERPGLFELKSLEPGLWDLLVRMETEEQGVLVEGVEVRAGETTRDPRLIDVDLRGKARVLEFQVVDENGDPVGLGNVSHREPGATKWESGYYFEDGAGHVFTSLDSIEVFVSAEGRRSELLPSLRDGETITLGPGIPVRVSWDGEKPEKVGSSFVSCSVYSTDPTKPSLDPDFVVSNDPDKLSYFPHAGTWTVVWFAQFRENGRNRQEELANDSFTIVDRSEPQSIALRPPAEVWNRIEAWKAEQGQ